MDPGDTALEPPVRGCRPGPGPAAPEGGGSILPVPGLDEAEVTEVFDLAVPGRPTVALAVAGLERGGADLLDAGRPPTFPRIPPPAPEPAPEPEPEPEKPEATTAVEAGPLALCTRCFLDAAAAAAAAAAGIILVTGGG